MPRLFKGRRRRREDRSVPEGNRTKTGNEVVFKIGGLEIVKHEAATTRTPLQALYAHRAEALARAVHVGLYGQSERKEGGDNCQAHEES